MSDLTRGDIIDAICALGVRGGDLLLAHTSLSSFGRVQGGARAVAEALVDSVGAQGSAFVPTFNYGTLPYDPATTPSLTGAVTDAFWRLPDALRSQHPTHSVAGVGPLAFEILRGHEKAHPFGRGSPLWRLWERNGWVLLMGCDHRASSVIHVAEEVMQTPYLHRTRTGLLSGEGAVTEVTVRRPGCSNGFNVVDAPMRHTGQIDEQVVGRSRLMLMRAEVVVAVASQLLSRDWGALLCHAPDCERCVWARQQITAHSRSLSCE